MHLVRREEFEVMRSMLEQSRLKHEQNEKKLAELEKLLDSQGSKEKPSSATIQEIVTLHPDINNQ